MIKKKKKKPDSFQVLCYMPIIHIILQPATFIKQKLPYISHPFDPT